MISFAQRRHSLNCCSRKGNAAEVNNILVQTTAFEQSRISQVKTNPVRHSWFLDQTLTRCDLTWELRRERFRIDSIVLRTYPADLLSLLHTSPHNMEHLRKSTTSPTLHPKDIQSLPMTLDNSAWKSIQVTGKLTRAHRAKKKIGQAASRELIKRLSA